MRRHHRPQRAKKATLLPRPQLKVSQRLSRYRIARWWDLLCGWLSSASSSQALVSPAGGSARATTAARRSFSANTHWLRPTKQRTEGTTHVRGALRSLFKVEPRTSWLNCRASKPAKATLGALAGSFSRAGCAASLRPGRTAPRTGGCSSVGHTLIHSAPANQYRRSHLRRRGTR